MGKERLHCAEVYVAGLLLRCCSFSFPGQEFTTAGVKTFELTAFQDVVSGVYRNLILSAAGTSLTDVHLFCRQACSQEACCDGFVLSQILLDGGNCGQPTDAEEEVHPGSAAIEREYVRTTTENREIQPG